jgi:CheY-like chemotaxis protein
MSSPPTTAGARHARVSNIWSRAGRSTTCICYCSSHYRGSSRDLDIPKSGSGFNVVEAGNADEAIAILEARPDIRVVFTDIQMPGSMDGLKLAQFVRGRWPPIKIVATSGFVNVANDDLPEGSRFLPKPYRPEQIVAELRELTAAA